jgi:multidrug efflux system membrane fusion protein
MRPPRIAPERPVALGIVAGAVVLGLVALLRVMRHPQTDDAIVMANIIGVVPQVSGTIVELHVADNQAVKRGDLLFLIDPRPYELAVRRARADVAALDGEIAVTQRRIDGQRFAVAAAKAAVQRMEAEKQNASDSLRRLEPLLAKEYVTPDKIDQARTAKRTAEAGLDEARRKMDQAEKDVGDLTRSPGEAAQAAPGKAELDLGLLRAREFDALVVNLNTAIGQFVAPGPHRCSRSSTRARGTSWRTSARPSRYIAPGWRRRSSADGSRARLQGPQGSRVGGESRTSRSPRVCG